MNASDFIEKVQDSQLSSYPCPDCDRVFGSREALDIHLMTVTGHRAKEDAVPTCDICGTTTDTARGLKTHKGLKHKSPASGAQPAPKTPAVQAPPRPPAPPAPREVVDDELRKMQLALRVFQDLAPDSQAWVLSRLDGDCMANG